MFEVRPRGAPETETSSSGRSVLRDRSGSRTSALRGPVRGCSLKTEEREPKASAGGISALSAAVSTVKKIHKRRMAFPCEMFQVAETRRFLLLYLQGFLSFSIDTLIFKLHTKVKISGHSINLVTMQTGFPTVFNFWMSLSQ